MTTLLKPSFAAVEISGTSGVAERMMHEVASVNSLLEAGGTHVPTGSSGNR